MSDDSTTPNTPTNVFQFPRLGFTLPPATPAVPTQGTPAGPGPAAPVGTGASGATRPDWDAVTVTDGGRRSPLDLINALPDPAILTPTHTPAAPVPGQVPATFHNQADTSDLVGPRLGALSLAAILAVAVAALNGTHTALSTWWENRQARAAEGAPLREARAKHQAAMQAIGDKAAEQRAKAASKVPSSSEFGRKTLGNRSSSGGSGSRSGSGGSSGGGRGAGGAGRGNSGAGSGPKKNTGPGRRPSTASGVGGPGSKSRSNARTPDQTKPKPKKPGYTVEPLPKKTPHKTPARTSPNGAKNSPAKRRGLANAAAKDTSKAAARRLKQRRKNLDKPALWSGDTTKPTTPKNPKKSKVSLNKGPKNGSGNGTAPNANTPKTKKNKRATGRTHLAHALRKTAQKAARQRLKQRRRTGITPPIWGTPKNPTKPDPASAGGAGDAGGTAKKPRSKANKPRTASQRASWGSRARARAQKSGRPGGGCFPGGTPGGPGGPGAPGTAGDPYDDGGDFWVFGKTRRSPFENAGQAAQTPPAYTVERDDYPGAQAKRWEPDAITTGTPALPATGPAALTAAPTPHTARPGTSRPKEPIAMPPTPARRTDPRITKAKHQAARAGHQVIAQARHMDARHETEITLDDALDQYQELVSDAFKTSDQTTKLAGRAAKLRDTLAVFAETLAVENNLIGALFTAALASLSESMDLVSRMADEMSISSLYAAEEAEGTSNDLDDAYRPYTQEAIDRNLPAPSAPAHNEA